MKTIAWTLAAVLLTAAPAAGQRPGPGGPGGRGQGGGPGMPVGQAGIERIVDLALERLDSLALSAEQVNKLEDLSADLGKSREQMQELHEKMLSTREDERAKLEEILSEPQRARLQELTRRVGLRGPRGQGGDPAGPGGPGRGGRGAGGRRDAAMGPGFGPGAAFAADGYRRGYRAGLQAARRFAAGRGGGRHGPGRGR